MLFDRRGVASLCVVLGLAIFLLTGCGGKSSTQTASAPGKAVPSSSASSGASNGNASTEKQFIALADPICRRVNAQLARADAKAPKTTNPKAPGFTAGLINNEGIERRGTSQLAKLAPPSELAVNWRKMLGYRGTLADQLGALADAIEHGAKASEATLITAKKTVHRQLREVAGQANFKDCAKVG